jgi:hypothetical protein
MTKIACTVSVGISGKVSPLLRLFSGLGLCFFSGLLLPEPVLANNPPEPQAALMVMAIPLVMYILTFLAGGYIVLANKDAQKSNLRKLGSSIANGLAYAFFIVMALATEGGTGLASLLFGLIAFQRGIMLILWSRRGNKDARDLPVDSFKLRSAGVLMLILVVFMALTPLFIISYEGYFPRRNRKINLENICSLAAASISLAQKRAAEGKPVDYRTILDPASRDDNDLLWNSGVDTRLLGKPFVKVEFSEDGTGFVIHLHPQKGMPPFPWNQLLSKPVYRVDESGKLRVMRTHLAREQCSPEAPVALDVKTLNTSENMDDMFRDLSR